MVDPIGVLARQHPRARRRRVDNPENIKLWSEKCYRPNSSGDTSERCKEETVGDDQREVGYGQDYVAEISSHDLRDGGISRLIEHVFLHRTGN